MKALFVHVPRCGGMSFYYFLEEIFGKENCTRFGDNNSVTGFLESDEKYIEAACLSGHVPYQFFRDRGCEKKRFSIAFLRNPEAREISCLSHMKGNDYSDHLGIPSENQEDYWKYFSSENTLHNIQSSYFSEDRKSISAADCILEGRICVFDIDDIFVVADVIKTFAKVNNMPAHTNGSESKNIELTIAGKKAIENHCAEDIALHTWVKNNRQFFLDQLKIELWKSYLQSE